MRNFLSNRFHPMIERVIRILEVVLALFLIVGVLGAGAMMVANLYGMLTSDSSQNFQHFLDDGLLYLIGLEVALMVVKRDPHLVVEILTFAIARKMIMNMQHGADFLFGALAILVLCLVRCYGISCVLLPPSFRRKWTQAHQQAEESGGTEPMENS